MKVQKYMLTSKTCGYCAQRKEELKEQIKSGEVKELPVETKKGLAVAEKLNISHVPTIVIRDGKNWKLAPGETK